MAPNLMYRGGGRDDDDDYRRRGEDREERNWNDPGDGDGMKRRERSRSKERRDRSRERQEGRGGGWAQGPRPDGYAPGFDGGMQFGPWLPEGDGMRFDGDNAGRYGRVDDDRGDRREPYDGYDHHHHGHRYRHHHHHHCGFMSPVLFLLLLPFFLLGVFVAARRLLTYYRTRQSLQGPRHEYVPLRTEANPIEEDPHGV